MTERWLLLAYACSGFAGLVYQIAWTRLLTLHLGHTTAAVSTVTAAFMGGLGLGGALGGRIASRLSRRQALWTYALLELVVALAALCDRGQPDAAHARVRVGVRRGRRRPVFSTVRIACSFAVLLVPGVALGATFPMAVRVAVTSPTRPGGPAGPAVWRQHGWRRDRLAGGRLLPHPDPRPHGHDADRHGGECREHRARTLASPGATSLTPCLRMRPPSRASSGRMPGTIARSRTPVASRQTSMVGTPSDSRYGLAAAVLALTGFATFVHEVVWTRVLAMVVGPSIYAFAATLTSFITGLALGSFAGAVSRRAQPSPGGCARADPDRHRGSGVRERRSRRRLTARDRARHVGTLRPRLAGIALPHLAIAFGLTLPIAFGLGVAFPLSLELAGSRDAIPGATTGRPLRGEYRGRGGRGSGGRLRRHTCRRPAHVTARRHHEPAARRGRAGRPWPFLESRPPCSAPSTRGCRRVDGHEPWLGS